MFSSVPVSLTLTPAAYAQGLVDAKGVLRLEDVTLLLDYRTQNRDFELGATQTAAIPLDDLETLAWQPGLLGNKITLQVRRLAALESICGAEGSRLVLRVERKDRQAAARFVSRVHLALSEHRLGDLDA